MSALVPTPQDHVTAVARAERRLWLLDVMIRFCGALMRGLDSGKAIAHLPTLARHRALAVVVRALGLCVKLRNETKRLLRDLRSGGLPAPEVRRARSGAAEAPPAPPAGTAYQGVSVITQVMASMEDLETAAQAEEGFRARLETLEWLLDDEGADPSPHETVQRLFCVLGLNPAWSRWLGDDWICANLSLPLSPPAGGSTGEAGEGGGGYARLPARPPPLASLPPSAEEERIAAPADPPVMIGDPVFRAALRDRVFEAIDREAVSEEEFVRLSEALDAQIARNERYMHGGWMPLLAATRRLCEVIRFTPDWRRWRDDGWIQGGALVRRRDAAPCDTLA